MAEHTKETGKTAEADLGQRRGEEMQKKEGKEPGRHDVGPRDENGRRAGTSTDRDKTGIGATGKNPNTGEEPE